MLLATYVQSFYNLSLTGNSQFKIWQLVTASWAHASYLHASGNALVLVVTSLLLKYSSAIRYWSELIAASVITNAVIAGLLSVDWYLGMSAVVYAAIARLMVEQNSHLGYLFLALLVAWVGAQLLIYQGDTLNWYEQNIVGTPILAEAHLVGIILGTAYGALGVARTQTSKI